jgi:hypothetical protein
MPRPFAIGASSKSVENAGTGGNQGKGTWARLLGWGRKRRGARGYSPQSSTRHLPGLKLEALEPRFLLSADILPFSIHMLGDEGGADYSIRLKYDNLIQTVQVFNDRTGILVSEKSAQEIEFIRVVGTAAADRLTIDFAQEFLNHVDIGFEGGEGDDVLALSGGAFADVTVAMSGDGAGSVTVNNAAGPQAISFSDVSTVSDTTAAGSKIFSDATGQGQTLRITENGTAGDGMSSIDAAGAGGALTYT